MKLKREHTINIHEEGVFALLHVSCGLKWLLVWSLHQITQHLLLVPHSAAAIYTALRLLCTD